MSRPRWWIPALLLSLSGCLYHAQERADQMVCDLASHPFDLAPPLPAEPAKPQEPAAEPGKEPSPPAQSTDLQTTALMETPPKGTMEYTQPFRIPRDLPGAQTPGFDVPTDLAGRRKMVQKLYPGLSVLPENSEKLLRMIVEKLYPELPALPENLPTLPGPGGHPYTLADLQQIAAANSPTVRQAAADIETARGNLIQARTYPNPTVGYEADTVGTGATSGYQGFFLDQPIKTGGKLKLQEAMARMDLLNAELALRRARSDLATQVRTAYYALLVARESVRVNRSLAQFTDKVYRLQVVLLTTQQAATYEPAALRAQAFAVRLALEQSLETYVYAWKQLVATIGLRDAPLTEVAGRVDLFIPRYDYNAVLAHALTRHTDVLTVQNTIQRARYNLKLAQVVPLFPDLDVRGVIQKDYTAAPFQIVHSIQVGLPLPIWDQNKGNIQAAEGTLVRASEEPHRVEVALTNNLATAFAAYRNNLKALEYYRTNILPDQVQAYRGFYLRRNVAGDVTFGDVATAQQTFVTGITTYLTVLGQLWSSAVSVADLLQTDDLFQLAQPEEVPSLPDLDRLLPLPCNHPCSPLLKGPDKCNQPALQPAVKDGPSSDARQAPRIGLNGGEEGTTLGLDPSPGKGKPQVACQDVSENHREVPSP